MLLPDDSTNSGLADQHDNTERYYRVQQTRLFGCAVKRFDSCHPDIVDLTLNYALT